MANFQESPSMADPVLHYLCDLCGKTFVRLADIQSHIQCHIGNKQYRCNVCKMDFQTLRNRRRHRRIHTGEKSYSCKFCDFDSHHRLALKKHLTTHTEKYYQCTICGKLLSTKTEMEIHVYSHVANRHCPLDETERQTSPETNSNHHEQINHARKIPRGSQYTRSTPEKPEKLHGDMNVHTDQTSFMCSRCQITFDQRERWYSHMMQHKREFEVCKKLFPCTDSPSKHQANTKLYEFVERQIPVCDSHVTTNDRECQARCRYCKKQFEREEFLAMHNLYSSCVDTLFKCKSCDKYFSRKSNMKRHMRTHKETSPQSTDENSQDRASELGVNVKETLPVSPDKTNMFRCHICDKYFGRKSNRNRHIKLHYKPGLKISVENNHHETEHVLSENEKAVVEIDDIPRSHFTIPSPRDQVIGENLNEVNQTHGKTLNEGGIHIAESPEILISLSTFETDHMAEHNLNRTETIHEKTDSEEGMHIEGFPAISRSQFNFDNNPFHVNERDFTESKATHKNALNENGTTIDECREISSYMYHCAVENPQSHMTEQELDDKNKNYEISTSVECINKRESLEIPTAYLNFEKLQALMTERDLDKESATIDTAVSEKDNLIEECQDISRARCFVKNTRNHVNEGDLSEETISTENSHADKYKLHCPLCHMHFKRKSSMSGHIRWHGRQVNWKETDISEFRELPKSPCKTEQANEYKETTREKAVDAKLTITGMNTKTSGNTHGKGTGQDCKRKITRESCNQFTFKCPICLKRFQRKSNRTVHIRTHFKIANKKVIGGYEDVSDNPFTNEKPRDHVNVRDLDDTHIAIHEKIENEKAITIVETCEVTRSKCSDRKPNVHETSQKLTDKRICTGKSLKAFIFKCPICFKNFQRKSNWTVHIRNHMRRVDQKETVTDEMHEVSKTDITIEQPRNKAPGQFLTQRKIKKITPEKTAANYQKTQLLETRRHLNEKTISHGEVHKKLTLKCPICFKTFQRKSNWTVHIRNHVRHANKKETDAGEIHGVSKTHVTVKKTQDSNEKKVTREKTTVEKGTVTKISHEISRSKPADRILPLSETWQYLKKKQISPGENHKKLTFRCPICFKNFQRKSNWTVHIRNHVRHVHKKETAIDVSKTHRSLEIPRNQAIKREFNEKKTTHENTANKKVTVTVKTKYQLTVGKQRFDWKWRTLKGKKIPTGESRINVPLKCPICSKSFQRKSNLTVHIRNHLRRMNEKEMVNDEFHKVTKSHYSNSSPQDQAVLQDFKMKKAIRKKNANAKDTAFEVSKSQMNEMKPRLNDQDFNGKKTSPGDLQKKFTFKCPVCSKYFQRKSNWTVHVRKHVKHVNRKETPTDELHRVSNTHCTNENPLEMTVHRTFKTMKGKPRGHVARQDFNEKMISTEETRENYKFQCNICDKYFKRKSSRTVHMRTHEKAGFQYTDGTLRGNETERDSNEGEGKAVNTPEKLQPRSIFERMSDYLNCPEYSEIATVTEDSPEILIAQSNLKKYIDEVETTVEELVDTGGNKLKNIDDSKSAQNGIDLRNTENNLDAITWAKSQPLQEIRMDHTVLNDNVVYIDHSIDAILI